MQILDPATGTGTFITNLIEYLPEDRLEYKYRNELHANEVAILPYYIANLNIEYTYREKTGTVPGVPEPGVRGHAGQHGLEGRDGRRGGAAGGIRARGYVVRQLVPDAAAEREDYQRDNRESAV